MGKELIIAPKDLVNLLSGSPYHPVEENGKFEIRDNNNKVKVPFGQGFDFNTVKDICYIMNMVYRDGVVAAVNAYNEANETDSTEDKK